MLKENQLIKTRWNPFTKKYYESLGYEYTGKNTELWVKIEDLPLNSHIKVEVICDFCGKEYSKAYKDYNVQHNGGDCCVDCEGIKSLKTGRERHGKNYRGEILREISLERYGVDNVAKLNEIQEKIRSTNLERYGMPCALFDKNNHEAYIVGNSPMAYEMSNSFNDELNYITILTMIAIFVVVAITFKSISIPAILVLIIQTAVYITMGYLSLLGGEVYFIALLIVQSILMGATIDYAILYTSYYLESRKTMDIKSAVINSYNKSIHTILTSSSILIPLTSTIQSREHRPQG